MQIFNVQSKNRQEASSVCTNRTNRLMEKLKRKPLTRVRKASPMPKIISIGHRANKKTRVRAAAAKADSLYEAKACHAHSETSLLYVS